MNGIDCAKLRELIRKYKPKEIAEQLACAVPDLLCEIERLKRDASYTSDAIDYLQDGGLNVEKENAILREALVEIANWEWNYDLDNVPECDILYRRFENRVHATHIPSGCVGNGHDKEQAMISMKRNVRTMYIPSEKKKRAKEVEPLVDIARQALAGAEVEW